MGLVLKCDLVPEVECGQPGMGHGKGVCSLVVVDSPLGCVTSLNAEIICLGEALFFEGGSNDAAAGANVGRFCRCGVWWEDVRLGEYGVFVVHGFNVGGGWGCGGMMACGD